MKDIRRRVVEKTLVHVPFEGWSDRALRAGADDAGVELGAARRAFPRGAADILAWWSADSDRRMVAELERRDLEAMPVRERIATAVRVRLEINRGHREAMRLALGRAALPPHAPEATRRLWRTVDAMWRAAGDTATDYNFYTKRALLAGVHASTLLYWLDDRSAGTAATWAFLERRIADVMRVPKALGTVRKCMPDPGRAIRAFRSSRVPR